jgi:hypothetical protein
VISRKLLWFIGLALAGVLAVTWWAGSYPARVVVINQGGFARAVTVATRGQEFRIGDLRPAETRVVSIPSGDRVTIEFENAKPRRWQSAEKIQPAQSMTVFIRDERIELQQPRRKLR